MAISAAADVAHVSKERWEGEGGNPTAVGVENHKVEEHVTPEVKNELRNGSVVIAAITSCTNTSNPSVMVATGLLAKKVVEERLSVSAWVQTFCATGSNVGQ